MLDKATHYFRKIQIKNLQRNINKRIEKEGLSDELLNKQVEVNEMRHKYNISDESQRIHEEYVQ